MAGCSTSWFSVQVLGMNLILEMCAAKAYIVHMPVKLLDAPKAERFVARVTRADKRIFQQAAALEGHSMATFVIHHAREAAEQILARRNTIRLNAEDSSRFVEALLAPPRPPNARMKRALKLYRETVVSDVNVKQAHASLACNTRATSRMDKTSRRSLSRTKPNSA